MFLTIALTPEKETSCYIWFFCPHKYYKNLTQIAKYCQVKFIVRC